VSSRESHPTALALRFFLVASTVLAIVAVRTAMRRIPAPRPAEPAPVAVALVAAPGEPIRAEAQVFRTTPGMLALDPAAPRERTAHRRDFRTYRFLRAFPGAPPRIPHALGPEEFRSAGCRTCHQRGGYSARFAAYVPVTPHPERGICLQCHAGEDSLMGVEVPVDNPKARCPQCHGPSGGRPRADASLTWPTSVWPLLPPRMADGAPPPIPHDLQFRENCLVCHSGPSAVAEIRMNHPPWPSCRQCHAALDPDAGNFTRGASVDVAKAGGTP
jgi:cytochrome c-type protein NapB